MMLVSVTYFSFGKSADRAVSENDGTCAVKVSHEDFIVVIWK